MKQYKYKEISLGGTIDVGFDRNNILSNLGKDGWRLISTFVIQHGTNPNSFELVAFLEQEYSNIKDNILDQLNNGCIKR